MGFVFYDTETTGVDTSFDQILQFGAIKADDNLDEIDRFEIRCRLLPWVVPSPGALRVTGVTPDMLNDASLPSHYEMMCQIEDRLENWSPAIFAGYNSISFDEELLRQAFFQTLRSPYLTNTHGNARFDILTAARACSVFAPNAIAVPIGDNGKPSFRLELLAAANGYILENAHDALADVGATIFVAKLIKERAPEVWDQLKLTSRKADVLALLEREEVLFQTEFYFNNEYSSVVTRCGQNPEYDAQVATFDLSNNPDPYVDLSVEALVDVLNGSPKVIRSVRANAQPILMPYEGSKPNLREPEITETVLRERAQRIRPALQFQENVGRALTLRFADREPSPYPEKQIYDGFPGYDDQRLMT